ncbi:hypothetical protein [Aureivirga sp. CE67]|uniref:hypothetical protein n=1 Tax=Aureivirga sp. CE67 TaxID=1788983 RepID=UPI0018CBE51C|nr:hypothetical protein [Aureivirga sp. CE67]
MKKILLLFVLFNTMFSVAQDRLNDSINQNQKKKKFWGGEYKRNKNKNHTLPEFSYGHEMYELDEKMRKGDFEALYEISKYLDSEKEIAEFICMVIYSTESQIAKRLIKENCFFLKNEINLEENSISTKSFRAFLNENKDKIVFSEAINGFVLTPFEEREVVYELTELTDFKFHELLNKKKELMELDWVKENNIDVLIENKNPKALLEIAFIYLKNRYRRFQKPLIYGKHETKDLFDENNIKKEDVIDLMELLTRTNLAVIGDYGKLEYNIEEAFYEEVRINVVAFFSKYYKDNKWDERRNIFVNPKLSINNTNHVDALFDKMFSKNDSIAINAFIELTQSDLVLVNEGIKKQKRTFLSDYNYVIPSFAYDFLEQLVQLTDYCKENQIDFLGNDELRKNIELLKSKLTVKERRFLENEIVEELTIENITAFEYWAIIYEKNWELTYSAGKIIDKFYSKNWETLLQNPKHLKCYVIKSYYYDHLGIIGNCNNYSNKFVNSSLETILLLKKLKKLNPKYELQFKEVISKAKTKLKFKEEKEKSSEVNYDNVRFDFLAELEQLEQLEKEDTYEYESKFDKIFSEIYYDQIEEALSVVNKTPFEAYDKYNFLERDFGFAILGDFDDANFREEFLKNYRKFSKKEFHEYYLEKIGIDYKKSDGTFDFDKVYEILKYDLKIAFVGGGGGVEDNGVYLLIKLLEIHFNTTLGFPEKLCNSHNVYGCTSLERANAWMNYLQVNKYVKEDIEPLSFSNFRN